MAWWEYYIRMPTGSLAKKTKAELIEEYKQLLEKQKELEATAREAYKPAHDDLFKKVDAHTDDTIERSLSQLRASFSNALNKLADSLHTEVQKLSDIKQAIEISKQRLAFHYHVEVAAGLVEKMLADYEVQKQQLETEIASRKREFDREQEETDYQSRVTLQRAREQREEEFQKRAKELAEKEARLKDLEVEAVDLKKRAESIPHEIEKEVGKREAEFKKRLEAEYKQMHDLAQKEADLTQKAMDGEMKSLRDQLSRRENEMASLRKEAELANKKAQELAVRVIESAGYQNKPTQSQNERAES